MPSLKNIDGNLGDGRFLSGPNDPNKSNESIILAPTTVALPAGTILGQVTATKLCKPLDPDASDGTQTFFGILWGARPISIGNQRAAAVVRDAVVNSNLVTYVVAADSTERAAVEAAAAAKMVMFRK